MSNQTTQYIKGLFIEMKEGTYGPFLSFGITDEGLKALQSLPKTDKGFRNWSASPQKDNPNKYSAKPPKSNDNGSPF